MRRLLMLLTTAIVVAGCAATPVAGEARPAGQPTEGPDTIGLPPRPRELPLDGIDPCALLTPAQRAELGLKEDSLPGVTDAPYFAGPTCSIIGVEPREIGVGLGLSTSTDLGQLLTPGTLSDEITPVVVSDFPAIIAKPNFVVDACSVDVSVARGQFLDIQFRDAGKSPPIPQEQLCQDALRVAEAAVGTLAEG